MLGLALLAQVSVSVIVQGAPTLAPFAQADLGLTRGEVGLFNSALMSGSLVMMLVAGWVVDVKGERVALVGGNLIVGAFCLCMLPTHSFAAALGVLFMAGVGGAFPTPAGSKTVMGWFPPALRGTAMGIRQTGIPLGGALAAAILPAIALVAGWRVALACGGLGCVLAAVLCALVYRNPPAQTPAQASAVALPPAPQAMRHILTLGVAGGLLTLGQFTLITYLALYLLETQHIAVAISASLLVAAQISGAVGRILWGVGSDRLFGGRRKPALLLANLTAAVGALVIGWLPANTSLWFIAPLVVVYAFNALGWHGNWVALLVELGGSARQGRTVSLGMSIMYPSIIILPPLFGWFVDHTHSWTGAWSLLSLVMLVGSALLARVPERARVV
jgi:MFS family permease